MLDRPHTSALDLLETFVCERNVSVKIERLQGEARWGCVLTANGASHQIFRGNGETAEAAIIAALRGAGVKPSGDDQRCA
jgi:hypothetical protein